jgi:hypothetical protein
MLAKVKSTWTNFENKHPRLSQLLTLPVSIVALPVVAVAGAWIGPLLVHASIKRKKKDEARARINHELKITLELLNLRKEAESSDTNAAEKIAKIDAIKNVISDAEHAIEKEILNKKVSTDNKWMFVEATAAMLGLGGMLFAAPVAIILGGVGFWSAFAARDMAPKRIREKVYKANAAFIKVLKVLEADAKILLDQTLANGNLDEISQSPKLNELLKSNEGLRARFDEAAQQTESAAPAPIVTKKPRMNPITL